MIKPLIAILLLVTSLLATKNEEKIVTKHEEKLFKFQETNDPALLYTEDSKSNIDMFCGNYIISAPDEGYMMPVGRLLGMAIVYPDAPLAKQYFPEEVVQAGRQSYIVSLEKNPDQRLLLAITDAWRHLIKMRGEDEAFNLAIKVYNDSATACNKKYTGGEQEMFKLIR